MEHIVITDTLSLTPQRETNRILRDAKSITVIAGGKEYTGECILSIDDVGGAFIEFPHTKKVKKAKPVGKAFDAEAK
jgi:hypothetical protein